MLRKEATRVLLDCRDDGKESVLKVDQRRNIRTDCSQPTCTEPIRRLPELVN